MEHIALAVIVTFMASTTQGIAGFGGGLISMGILSTFWPVSTATAALVPLGFVLNLTLISRLKKHLDISLITPFLVGIPFGVVIGVLGLESLPDVLLRGALGLALLAAVANVLWGRPFGTLPPYISWIGGALSGMTGAALSSPGPPALIYATLSGWERDRFRAQLSMIFLVASALSLIGLTARGILTMETISISAYLIPSVIIGSVCGVKLGGYLPQRRFRALVVLLLTALALKFLWVVVATYL